MSLRSGPHRRQTFFRVTQVAAVVSPRWSTEESADLYGPDRWGEGYFRVGADGSLLVTPTREPDRATSVVEIVKQLAARDIHPPFTVRFPQILEDRIRRIHESFLRSMDEFDYKSGLRLVYPMKVNQRKEVVQELLRSGDPWNYGLEVGSKPELLSALALETPDDALLIANGFKDTEFVELAASGVELGKNVIVVLDKLDEAHLVTKVLKEQPHKPHLGIRVKLAARGHGKWAESGGERAKFGLTVPELLHALEILKKAGLADRIKMIHFHIGSQVSDIKRIHAGVQEAARIYCKLHRMGIPVDTVDVGGGMGVDYDGSGTASSASINYDMREYTNTIVYTLRTVADEEGVPHPTIVSESGRAVVAHQSMLVLELLKRVPEEMPLDQALPAEGDHRIVHELNESLGGITLKNYPEAYHDALSSRDEAMQRFNLGVLSLSERAKAETLFRAIAAKVLKFADRDDNLTDEFLDLRKMLQHKFIANFSLFQSTPDVWGVRQVFPIMPLTRLDKRPSEFGTIVDITCDSDGEIRRFIDVVDVKDTLELHELDDDPYHIGIFLTGAYQDTLGDFHNLFGRVHEAYVTLDENGRPSVDRLVEGDTVEEVLWLVNWERGELMDLMRDQLRKKARSGLLTDERAAEVIEGFRVALDGYTYLEE